MTLLEKYTDEYLEKIFYFCLKKTGQENDAADLAGTINLEVTKALLQGVVPDRFEAWVWTIARNQWSRWAGNTFYKNPQQVDIMDYEEKLPSEDNVSDAVIQSVELEKLRRELAFIRKDYRQILVAHYFEEMSVSAISDQYHIPLGTVKTKLQTSRKLLKEGMDMAREFGQRSFNPETIGFSSSGRQPTGLPWSAVSRLIPVNILCEANNNPSTIEELSMELGIAVPYMEEEVKLLEEAELLKKVEKEKYLTNFFIAPKECLNEIYELCSQYAEKSYDKIWEIAQKILDFVTEKGSLHGITATEDAVAYFAFETERCLEHEIVSDEVFERFHRKDGGTWGFMGREKGASCRCPMASFSDMIIVGDSFLWKGYQRDEFTVDGLQIYDKKRYTKDCTRELLYTLKNIALGMDENSFQESDRQHLQILTEYGYCTKNGGKIEINALVFTREDFKEVQDFMRALPEYQELLYKMGEHFLQMKKVISKYSVPYLEKDFDFYVAISNVIRPIAAALWKEEGRYAGNSAQFYAFIYDKK